MSAEQIGIDLKGRRNGPDGWFAARVRTTAKAGAIDSPPYR